MKEFTLNEIVKIALESGATLAGVANVEDLKKSPAFTVIAKMPKYNGVGTCMCGENDNFLPEVVWPEEIKSVVVLAYHHPVSEPKMDYWVDGYNTIGNRRLIDIGKKFKSIMEKEGVATYSFNYHIEKGGIFLKDSAVVAGLGCIGRNNLLINPQYGPYIRLRAIGLNLDLPSIGPLEYDPCDKCEVKCWENCTKGAFSKKIYSEVELGRSELPGRIGNFNRLVCDIQMKEDEVNIIRVEIPEKSDKSFGKVVKYCRYCEYACPIGK
jgi:epoxyqueuosine reductase